MSKGAPRRTGRADVLIAGGGTAGHVLPAITVAKSLVNDGIEAGAIQFVGSRRGMEATFVPESGFGITLLPGRGIVRRLALVNIQAIGALLLACVMSLRLLRSTRPHVLAVVGGYASVPPALAAFIWRVPIVVINVDSVPGAANRLIGRVAKACAVAFADTELPRSVLTGAPVRADVLALDLSDAARMQRRHALHVSKDQKLVVVTGGSLGARRLNDVASGLVRYLASRGDIVLHHVSGVRDAQRVEAERDVPVSEGPSYLDYRLVAYEDHLPELFASADLVIARSGASTVAELAVLGTPSILVPLPNSPGNHQWHNAQRLAQDGAAIIVDDEKATPETIGGIVEELLGDDDRRRSMSAAAQHLGVRDGANHIARLIEQCSSPPLEAKRDRASEEDKGKVTP